MDTTKKYVLVTIEEPDTRVPKVLEDYIHSLNLFDDVKIGRASCRERV